MNTISNSKRNVARTGSDAPRFQRRFLRAFVARGVEAPLVTVGISDKPHRTVSAAINAKVSRLVRSRTRVKAIDGEYPETQVQILSRFVAGVLAPAERLTEGRKPTGKTTTWPRLFGPKGKSDTPASLQVPCQWQSNLQRLSLSQHSKSAVCARSSNGRALTKRGEWLAVQVRPGAFNNQAVPTPAGGP